MLVLPHLKINSNISLSVHCFVSSITTVTLREVKSICKSISLSPRFLRKELRTAFSHPPQVISTLKLNVCGIVVTVLSELCSSCKKTKWAMYWTIYIFNWILDLIPSFMKNLQINAGMTKQVDIRRTIDNKKLTFRCRLWAVNSYFSLK